MAVKHPIMYELSPQKIDPGTRWLTLRLKNVGEEALRSLDVRLNSLDTYSISVQGLGRFWGLLAGGDEMEFPFQVLADSSGRLYASIDGWKVDERFHWESPGVLISVGEPMAELVSLYAVADEHPDKGVAIRCEAVVRGLCDYEGLELSFLAETPRGELMELPTVEAAGCVGEQQIYGAQMETDQAGLFTIHAYLNEGPRRIGHEITHLYILSVEEAALSPGKRTPRSSPYSSSRST
ncbi:MAG: hypothetical protein AMJ93_08695 [Anaerolineae bacterium SM23_84]|nr:MAG: hypothetical protein AMJ93_08695 [Anaerolineae bacterium SM23_84]